MHPAVATLIFGAAASLTALATNDVEAAVVLAGITTLYYFIMDWSKLDTR